MRRKCGPEFLGYLWGICPEPELRAASRLFLTTVPFPALIPVHVTQEHSGSSSYPKKLELIKVLAGLPSAQAQVLPLGVNHGPPEFPRTYGSWWFERQGKPHSGLKTGKPTWAEVWPPPLGILQWHMS